MRLGLLTESFPRKPFPLPPHPRPYFLGLHNIATMQKLKLWTGVVRGGEGGFGTSFFYGPFCKHVPAARASHGSKSTKRTEAVLYAGMRFGAI